MSRGMFGAILGVGMFALAAFLAWSASESRRAGARFRPSVQKRAERRARALESLAVSLSTAALFVFVSAISNP